MRLYPAALSCCVWLAACSSAPRTDDELAAQAQNAVNHKLDAQATFSMMESAIVLHIACGHAHAVVPSGATVDRDFVYKGDRLIMDDEAGFDAAAAQCDAAIGGSDSDDNSQ